MAAESMSTPLNTISREALSVLIKNNILDRSVEFKDQDVMETDSPVRKRDLQLISKKLFHSPITHEDDNQRKAEPSRKATKRKHPLLPSSGEKITKVFIREYEQDNYNPDDSVGMRKKILISLFHNKEYCMDASI